MFQIRNRRHLHPGEATAQGVLIDGSLEALGEELRSVFEMMAGEHGSEFRAKIAVVRDILLKDTAEGGEAWKDLKSFGQLGSD